MAWSRRSLRGGELNVREDVFISYSTRGEIDRQLASSLQAYLESAGLSVWRDQSKLYGGAEFVEEIIRGLQRSKSVVCLFSEKSYRRPYVLAEFHAAMRFQKAIPTVVAPFTNRRVPFSASSRLQVLSCNSENDFEKIADAIRQVRERPNTDQILRSEPMPRDATLRTLATLESLPSSLNLSQLQTDLQAASAAIYQSGRPDLVSALEIYNNPSLVLQGLFLMRDELHADDRDLWKAVATLALPFHAGIAALALYRSGADDNLVLASSGYSREEVAERSASQEATPLPKAKLALEQPIVLPTTESPRDIPDARGTPVAALGRTMFIVLALMILYALSFSD